MLRYPKRVKICDENELFQEDFEKNIEDVTSRGGYVTIHKVHPADEYVLTTTQAYEDNWDYEKLY